MLAVALSLLPGLGLLLFLMTHIEDRLLSRDSSPRPPRLRVLPGGRSASAGTTPAEARHARRGRHAA
ncbi:hypothetical protein ACFYOV_24590 [Streptomyces sp. NPDC005931]|uniref:hypothetical protein n=1 Tax=Streptomyces sp. NPDC005931 TaxID=3364737 RepID=UPI0036C9B065